MRRPQVPLGAWVVMDKLTKADLIEVAWHLASLCHDQGADEQPATFDRLVEEVNIIRRNQGRKELDVSWTWEGYNKEASDGTA